MAFKPGFDPNRNLTIPGPGRTPEYELKNITGPARQKLVEKIVEVISAPVGEVERIIKEMSENLSVGDTLVFNTLMNVARKEPTLDNMMKILKILGHKFEEPAQVNVSMSLESLVADAISNEEKIVTPDGQTVIRRRKKQDELMEE